MYKLLLGALVAIIGFSAVATIFGPVVMHMVNVLTTLPIP